VIAAMMLFSFITMELILIMVLAGFVGL